jgi:hypothetical protein
VARYPEFLFSSELANLVLALHTPFLTTDASELLRRIQLYPQYHLQHMGLVDLSVRFDDWSNDERVLKYSKMDVFTLPPIVLGCIYTDGRYEVVDGLHRAVAMKKRGECNIRAFVPIGY